MNKLRSKDRAASVDDNRPKTMQLTSSQTLKNMNERIFLSPNRDERLDVKVHRFDENQEKLITYL